jgi:hypothetical protein
MVTLVSTSGSAFIWTESKIDQNKIASDVASKLNQRRRPEESVENWHRDTLHLLEQYRRTTSVAYPPSIAVDTLLTRLNLLPGSFAADKVLLCRAATVPADSTLLTEVNRDIASLYPLFATYEHNELVNPTFPPRRWLFVTVSCRTSVQDLLYLQCPRECP